MKRWLWLCLLQDIWMMLSHSSCNLLPFSVWSSAAVRVAFGRPSSWLCWAARWWWLKKETPSPGTMCSTSGPTPFTTSGDSGPRSSTESSVLAPSTTSVSVHTSFVFFFLSFDDNLPNKQRSRLVEVDWKLNCDTHSLIFSSRKEDAS